MEQGDEVPAQPEVGVQPSVHQDGGDEDRRRARRPPRARRGLRSPALEEPGGEGDQRQPVRGVSGPQRDRVQEERAVGVAVSETRAGLRGVLPGAGEDHGGEQHDRVAHRAA